MTLLQQTLLLGSGLWEAWGWTFPVKSRAKKVLSMWIFSIATRSPVPGSRGSTFCSACLLLLIVALHPLSVWAAAGCWFPQCCPCMHSCVSAPLAQPLSASTSCVLLKQRSELVHFTLPYLERCETSKINIFKFSLINYSTLGMKCLNEKMSVPLKQ